MDRVVQLVNEKLQRAQAGVKILQERIDLNNEENSDLEDKLAAAQIEVQELSDFLNNYEG